METFGVSRWLKGIVWFWWNHFFLYFSVYSLWHVNIQKGNVAFCTMRELALKTLISVYQTVLHGTTSTYIMFSNNRKVIFF